MSTSTRMIAAALIISSVIVVFTWMFLLFMIMDINAFHQQETDELEEFKELSNQSWKTMRMDTQGFSMMDTHARHPRRAYAKREHSPGQEPQYNTGRTVSVMGMPIADTCNCCPNEMSRFGINENCPKGRMGTRGLAGENGESGIPGENGRPGLHGSLLGSDITTECIICPMGPRGPQGEQGSVGIQGPPGRDGPPGSPGMDGAPGPAGPPGEPGIDGQHGMPGTPGQKGAPMIRLIGKPGPAGPPGVAGPTGPAGPPGAQAPQGQPGVQGPEGPEGRRGRNGVNGPPGEPGHPGETGNDAGYCPCPPRSIGVEGMQNYQPGGEYSRWRKLYRQKVRVNK